jgi:Protein of unknown function (DUF1778)
MPTAANRRDARNHLSNEPIGTIVSETEMVVLTARDWEAFLVEWNDPDRPRPRLEAAVRRYRSRRQPDVG